MSGGVVIETPLTSSMMPLRDSAAGAAEEGGRGSELYEIVPLSSSEVVEKLEHLLRALINSLRYAHSEETFESGNALFSSSSPMVLAFKSPGPTVWGEDGKPRTSAVGRHLYYGPTMLRVLIVIREIIRLVRNHQTATQREIYYSLKNYFRNQNGCDYAIKTVCSMLKTFRSCVGIVAASRGSFAGRVLVRDSAEPHWTLAMSADDHFVGFPVTPASLSISALSTLHLRRTSVWPALCILVIEKDAVYQRLIQARFYDTYPCIMITGRGMPSFATRAFVKQLHEQLRLPVFILVDYNPYGLRIASAYMSGASPEAQHYGVPSAQVVGILSKHILDANCPGSLTTSIRDDCFQPFRPSDESCVQSLRGNAFLSRFRPHLIEEAERMLTLQKTLEIEAIYSLRGIDYFTSSWLPIELMQARSRFECDRRRYSTVI